MADLRGHTVGVPGKFGESWFALVTGLRQAGLTESDVTVVEIGYTPQPALTTGQVDALVGFSNSDLLNFAAAGIPVRSIDPDVPLVSICLATTAEYAKAHPDIVSLVASGMMRGMEEAITDPARTLEIAGDYIPAFHDEIRDQAAIVLPATTALFVDDQGKVSPTFDAEQWAKMATAMERAGLIPAGVDAASAYINI
jgi:NitT/TauT family transport system substrate-binding protein